MYYFDENWAYIWWLKPVDEMTQAKSLHGDVHTVRYDDNKMKASLHHHDAGRLLLTSAVLTYIIHRVFLVS